MSRIFRSTTALTAVIGLLAPSVASAETVLTQNEFRQMQQRTAEGQPLLAAALENEVAAGLTADGLACMDGSARPCADGVPLKTPMGLAVWPGEDGGIVLAPRKDQDRAVADAVGAATAEADPEARVVAQAEGEVIPPLPDGAGEEAAAEAAQKAKQAAGEADNGDGKAERAKRKAERAEAREKADEPVAAEEGDGGDARSERAKERAERAEARERGAEPVPPAASEDAPSADSLAESLAREGEPEGRSPEARAPEATEAPPVAREPDAVPDREERRRQTETAPIPVDDGPAVAREPDAVPLREERRQTETAPVTPDDGPAVAREPDTAADRAERRRQTETAPAPVPAEDAPTADDLAEALGAADDGADNGAPQPVVADTAAAVAAATGQREAPKPVEVTPDEQQALADALAKSEADREARRAERRAAREQAAQQDDAPTPVAPADGDSDGDGDTDAIAAAAASSAPAVAALTAPARLGEDARTVVVTEGSARSSAEDFATSIAEAVAAAKDRGVTPDGQPVVAAPGTDNDRDRDRQEARRDDDDDDDNTLRNVLLAGLGAYAVGTLLANQNRVALNTGDRVVVQAPDGSQQVWKDDNALLLQPGAQVTTENFSDGSSRSIVTRSDGSRVVTIRDAQLRVLRRTLIAADGTTTELINDAEPVPPVEVAALPPPARPVAVSPTDVSPDELRRALEQEAAISRRFSLSQIRDISQVRNLVAPISIDSITFDTGSAAIRPTQAQQLATLGGTIADMIRQNPAEVFLIEGYTDTVGAADMNLALSDRRAESLALALTEYFQVPPENMVVQGYGERFLKVAQEGDVRANRRVAVRRITDLLQN